MISRWGSGFGIQFSRSKDRSVNERVVRISASKRMARGFKNFIYFRTAAYHRAGKLTLALPTIT
jgi:hypothetical protein